MYSAYARKCVHRVIVARRWNHLPRDVVNGKSLSLFRKKLNDHFNDIKYLCDPVLFSLRNAATEKTSHSSLPNFDKVVKVTLPRS